MQQALSGRVAIVAGGARPPGIGHATALRLAGRGASVALIEAVSDKPAEWRSDAYDTGFVRPGLLGEVAAEVAGATHTDVASFAADPFDQTSWEREALAAIARFGRVDICCALMGATGPYAGDGPLLDVPLASLQRSFDVNVLAPLLLVRACARDMIGRGAGGTIVVLSSYAAVVPSSGAGAISAARAAVNTLIGVLALELGPYGIRVNGVQPLNVQSGDERFPNPALDRLGRAGADSSDRPARVQVPLARPQSPDETAAVIEFLCSDEASFVSGVSIPVAGGSHSHA
jgi:NAD(P)-dependent dehydrogenase (short-subunit alcohol dehydrogenase family)